MRIEDNILKGELDAKFKLKNDELQKLQNLRIEAIDKFNTTSKSLDMAKKKGNDLSKKAQELVDVAKEKGGSLEVDSDPADITDGFILKYGDIEENCTFDAIFDSKRDELRDLVNKNLFNK